MLRAIALLLLVAPLLPAQTGVTVDGTVTNRVTGAGIAGVSVTLFTRQAVRYQTTTDDSGAFRIPGMSPGSYQALYEKTGFTFFGLNLAGPYNIAAGQSPPRIRLEMTQLVTLRGRVLDPDGKPTKNVEVRLGSYPGKVSAQGDFTIETIQPGSYPLLASPIGARPVVTQQDRTEVVPTYFPSVIDSSAAQRIVVRGDGDLDGFEIRLQSVPVYRVSGIVRDQTGNPTAGVKLRLLPVLQEQVRVLGGMNGEFLTFAGPGPTTGSEEGNTSSGEDGSFEFSAVRSGEWEIDAQVMGAIDSVNFADTFRTGAAEAIVGRSDLDRLEILLAAPPRLTGTVEWGDATPQRDRAFGAFSAARVSPGRYLILPQFGSGYYPVSVMLGGSEVFGQPIGLGPGSPPLRVSYRAARGSVSGTVENGAAATIVLLPQQIQTLAFGRVVRSKPDGAFDMAGVVPGDYFAVAVNQLDTRSEAFHDPAFLNKVAGVGVRVRVDQDPVPPIKLKPIRWPE
jgi:hypothetical protein